MFKRAVECDSQGDRVGICVTQFDPALLERGLAATPDVVPTFSLAIVSTTKIKYFKQPIKRNSKFHVTVGHSTVMAIANFFSADSTRVGQYDLLPDSVDLSKEYLHSEELSIINETHPAHSQWAVLHFEKPITAPLKSLFIASRLDTDVHTRQCRLAFFGRVLAACDNLQNLKVYKNKERKGQLERLVDEHTIIGKGLFKKQTDLQPFLGLKVERISNGAVGVIESSFGKTGKFKIHFPDGGQQDAQGGIILKYKAYIFQKDKKAFIQS